MPPEWMDICEAGNPMNADRGRALVEATEVDCPSLVPEVRLHLLPAASCFETFRAEHESWLGAAPPYWAVAWPGGQALARYMVDHRARFAGARVVDLGCGGGVAAIASVFAGAARARGVDRDPNAIRAAALNARLNGVSIDWQVKDIDLEACLEADFVLAGDLWYDGFDGRKSTQLLRRVARTGARVLCGDVGRAHFPRQGMQRLASYDMRTTHGLERMQRLSVHVWELHA